jgi:hypothetical protein
MIRHLEIRRAGWRGGRLLLLTLALSFSLPAAARAYTPESPEVRALIDGALAWLETQTDRRLGGKCLIGLSFFKSGRPLDHPKILEAQEACETSARTIDTLDNYSLGLAVVFLCETEPYKNRALAEQYVAALLKKQMGIGSWSYANYATGDTSQTQYPTLGLWLAARNGIDVPPDRVEKICAWLVRTQDPSGAWGYQGNDPGGYQRVRQPDVKPSLAAAGLGSLYICADLLEVSKAPEPKEERTQPAALRAVETEEQRARRRNAGLNTIDAQVVRRGMADGNTWFDRNFTVEPREYVHYYLYALERYYSFREMAEGRTDPNPKWYNAGVEMLQSTRQPEGHWQGQDNSVVATSFAVLFLARASQQMTKKSGRLGDAVLLGGMGLPPNTADLREQDGKIVETPFAGTVDELLTVLNDPDNPELARLADGHKPLPLDSDVTKRSGQIAQLRALVSAGSFDSRLVAVRTLGRVRDLDNAPVLIYALTDPDLRIVLEADKGLRFISRKFGGVGLPVEPKPDDVQTAIRNWKAWYKAVRPAGELLD